MCQQTDQTRPEFEMLVNNPNNNVFLNLFEEFVTI